MKFRLTSTRLKKTGCIPFKKYSKDYFRIKGTYDGGLSCIFCIFTTFTIPNLVFREIRFVCVIFVSLYSIVRSVKRTRIGP